MSGRMTSKKNYYQVLGVPRDASPEEIRKAYFDLARQTHPDVSPDPTSREKFIELQEAYEALSDPDRRAAYDAELGPYELPAVTIHTRYSRSVVPALPEQQLVYVLLEMVCTASEEKATKLPVHIALVLDVSTSMKGSRMDMVKASTSHLIRKLTPQDTISVVAFSDRAEVIVPPSYPLPIDLPRIDQKISLLSPSGGTEIFQGLRAGIEQLRGFEGEIRHLILLTDGHTYGDEEHCIELVKQAEQEGISFSAVGIGHEWNDAFLDRLATAGGGNAIFVTKPRELSAYFEQRINNLGAVYARGVNFEFESDRDVVMRYVFRMYPDVSPLESKSPIQLGNMYAGKNLVLLMEFLLPATTEREHIVLAQGCVKMQLIHNGEKVRIPVKFERQVQLNPEPEVPSAMLIEALSKISLYRLQERARKEVERGNTIAASRHLQYLATHLLSTGNRELAHTVLVEAEHVKQSKHFTQEGDKRIKYGTRALMLPSGMEK